LVALVHYLAPVMFSAEFSEAKQGLLTSQFSVGMFDVLRLGTPLKIDNAVIVLISVQVVHLRLVFRVLSEDASDKPMNVHIFQSTSL
jgi:hypothetical protein